MDYRFKERPYYTVNDFYKEKFGTKVFKIPLNGNFTCPNRDGTLSYEGCIYCSEKGSGDFAGDVLDSMQTQYAKISATMRKKWPTGKTIAYFQANTNTYGPLEKLKLLYEKALTLDPNIVGISIATRPDCLQPEIVEYLADLNRRTFLTIELGLQTIHPETAEIINRKHDLQTFVDAVKRLRAHDIHVVCHIINGLPHETAAMMQETVRFLNGLDIQGLKIHMLYIMKNTALETLYLVDPFKILSRDEYVGIVSCQIEHLRPDIILYRLTGDGPRDELIEPKWSLKKFVVTNEIDKLLRNRHSYQGAKYQDD